MTRALAVVAVMATVLTGCVSVAGPTEQPTGGPSFGVTTPAPATAGPTFPTLTLPPITIPPLTLPPITIPPVTVPPVTLPPVTLPPVTAPPTVAPTEPPPTTAPTEAPSIPVETPPTGDGDALISDNMDDPSSGWTIFDAEFSTIAYADSALRITINQGPAYGYADRSLGGDFGTVLVAGELEPTGSAAAGLLCISSAAEEAYGVVFGASGNVIFVSIIGGEVTVLENNAGIGVPFVEGESQVAGLACSGLSTGALRMVAFGDRTGPLASYQNNEGPESFGAVGLYGEADDAGDTVDFHAAAVYGIPGSADGMTPEAEELLTHVPSLWSEQCIESPRTEAETAAVVCFLQQDGAGPELASYESYSSNTDMDAAYQDRVADFAVEDTDSCDSGPINTTWHIDDETLGLLLCAPQQVGTRIDWTDDRLAILSSLIDFEGDYGLNYTAWQEAGPNP